MTGFTLGRRSVRRSLLATASSLPSPSGAGQGRTQITLAGISILRIRIHSVVQTRTRSSWTGPRSTISLVTVSTTFPFGLYSTLRLRCHTAERSSSRYRQFHVLALSFFSSITTMTMPMAKSGYTAVPVARSEPTRMDLQRWIWCFLSNSAFLSHQCRPPVGDVLRRHTIRNRLINPPVASNLLCRNKRISPITSMR